jgi:ribosome biogenesis GTPase / thiamine phosphate phosphatase
VAQRGTRKGKRRKGGDPPPKASHFGRVVGRIGPVLIVETEAGALVRCVAQGRRKTVVVGDNVGFAPDTETTLAQGLVLEVLERRSALTRADALGRREQILAANIDTIFIVVCTEPPLREGLIDRYLVAAEMQGIDAEIVFNKVDLIASDPEQLEEVAARLAAYPPLGYPVHFVSAHAGHGVNELAGAFEEQTSILVGHSGVGKTSLLNALNPVLAERVNELSDSSGRGQHTTSASALYHLPGGGDVIDSPGVRAFAIWDLDPRELRDYFVEMKALVKACKFGDCQHMHEPGCAVLEALEEGDIAASRYESYLKIRESLDGADEVNRFF